MILRGVGVRILAENIPLLYDFYTEKLGFKVVWGDRNGPYVSFAEADKDRASFAIFQREKVSMYKGYTPFNGKEKTDSVVLTTGMDDIDGYYTLLKSKGVDLLGEVQNMPAWGYRCFYFRDPEGNLFEVAGAIKEEN